jgi:integrase
MASLQKRGPNSYLLVVEAGYDSNGKRIKKTKTIQSRTKKEAEAELARFIVFVESGMYRTPSKMTLFEFTVEWKTKYAQTELSPLTLKTYNHHLENHILPALGHLKLDEIKPMHILSLLENLRKPGARKDKVAGILSSGTIEYIYRVIKNIFSRATDWGILTHSPMASIKKPKVTQQKLKKHSAEKILLPSRLYHIDARCLCRGKSSQDTRLLFFCRTPWYIDCD